MFVNSEHRAINFVLMKWARRKLQSSLLETHTQPTHRGFIYEAQLSSFNFSERKLTCVVICNIAQYSSLRIVMTIGVIGVLATDSVGGAKARLCNQNSLVTHAPGTEMIPSIPFVNLSI